MFSKKHDKIETIIGVNSQIRGSVELKGTIRIDGNFEGEIRADWVVIGEKGHVKGEIQASGVLIGGLIEGNITAHEYIEIMAKGRVLGDVITQRLAILEGGLFEGRSKMQKTKPEGEISIIFKQEIE